METAELDLTTEQTTEATFEELPTDFEILYDAVLSGDTTAAYAAADLCEEEGDLPCALALRSMAAAVTLGKLTLWIAPDGPNWVLFAERNGTPTSFTRADLHDALTLARDLIEPLAATETASIATAQTATPAASPADFAKAAQDTMLRLAGRWADEKDFEDIEDYRAPLLPIAERFGATIGRMLRRPFGCEFTLSGRRYRLIVTSRRYACEPIR